LKGAGVFSDLVGFNPLPGLPCAAPSAATMTVTPISSTSISVLFPAVSAADINGVWTGYNVTVEDRSSIFLANSTVDETVTSYAFDKAQLLASATTNNNDQFVVQIDGLNAYTTYAVSVAATNNVGQGPFSESLTTKTGQSVPSAPTNLIARATANQTSVVLVWDAPDPTNGVVVGYLLAVNVTIKNTNTFQTYNASLPANASSYEVLGTSEVCLVLRIDVVYLLVYF